MLAGKISALLPDVIFRRAVRTGEVRLVGFDESVSPEELARALAGSAACEVGKIRMGIPRSGPRGIGAIWVRLPFAAASAVVRVGLVRVGWSSVRVEFLGGRPLQLYKCWGFGHTRAACPATATDRTGACYRCGGDGHREADCTAVPACAICHGAERDARHRTGFGAWRMARREREGRGGRAGRRRRGRPFAHGGLGGGT